MPTEIQDLARRNYQLLRVNPRHPSLRFKKVGGYWSVRIGRDYRALGSDVEDGILWAVAEGHDHLLRGIKQPTHEVRELSARVDVQVSARLVMPE